MKITMKITVITFILLLTAACLCACIANTPPPLPEAQADGEGMFNVDKNINIETIDNYLDRDDVEYIDVRMLYDPARFEEIGGASNLSRTIRGFRIVPYPFIASLTELPVPGAYNGPRLFDIVWGDAGQIITVTPNFIESDIIIQDIFPKDKAIFLMCGGGGYADMMKTLLVFLGWNHENIYIVGANWNYTGENSVELVIYPEDARDREIIATWRADYVFIDFLRLTPV